jgi:protein involved in polysaccharide export with SLBB domain
MREMTGMTRKLTTKFWLALCLIVALSPAAFAEYIVGIDDVLDIVFWQAPELKQVAVVNSDGKISLSVIGEITAAGLTTSALGRKIVEQVSRFNRDISQATVTVTEYNSQTVFVEGEVMAPGRYAREVIPDLWTIIKEMGGVSAVGDLRNVKIIRGSGSDLGKIISVDVLSAVSSRDFSSLPKILPHDVIRVPRTLSGIPSTGAPTETEGGRNVYYVVGAVARPGVYTLESGLGLLEAIAIAGGTLPTANLKGIMVNSRAGEYANVYTINISKQMKQGSPSRYMLRSEDAIIVPEKGGTLLGVGFGALRDVLTFGTTITSTILLIDRFKQ